MANPDAVGQLNLDSFSNGRIGVVRATTLNTAGNGVVTIPILGGGLTNGGGVANSGGIIVRRVTFQNSSGNVSNANVSISTTSDGANLVTANTVLTALSTVGRYVDINAAAPFTSNVVPGNVTQCLFVNVNAIANNGNTVDICVYGDVVSF
jgi:hypothetical protein